jgi:hypothetical protein
MKERHLRAAAEDLGDERRRAHETNGSGTSVGCTPSVMLVPLSPSSTMLVWKVTTLTSGWA